MSAAKRSKVQIKKRSEQLLAISRNRGICELQDLDLNLSYGIEFLKGLPRFWGSGYSRVETVDSGYPGYFLYDNIDVKIMIVIG